MKHRLTKLEQLKVRGMAMRESRLYERWYSTRAQLRYLRDACAHRYHKTKPDKHGEWAYECRDCGRVLREDARWP